MLRKLIVPIALVATFAGAAKAEEHVVRMLNRGEAGTMVFEPGFVQAQAGDTIRFVPTDRGHNAVLIEGLAPEGAAPFEGKINEELVVTLDTEGVYGVMCKPHFAMGMVMSIAVGDVEVPEGFLEGRLPRTAKTRFEEQLSNL
ncbi:pseudoazurin (plasmid) [Aestuarium zhoushanense]|nr:pseudoazurin [Aestuarium zhoushanense]